MKNLNDEIERLFEEQKHRLYGLALRITGRHADAEDVLQETWLAVLRARSGFRGDSKLSTWVYQIALRTALRHKARRGHAPLDLDPSAKPSHDRLEDQEALARLLKAMSSLPAEQRIVLALSTLDDMPSSEIAEVLNLPQGTVWSRLHIARTALMKAMKEQSDVS